MGGGRGLGRVMGEEKRKTRGGGVDLSREEGGGKGGSTTVRMCIEF